MTGLAVVYHRSSIGERATQAGWVMEQMQRSQQEMLLWMAGTSNGRREQRREVERVEEIPQEPRWPGSV